MLIRLVWVGRTRSPAAARWIETYRERIGRFCPVEIVEVKDAPGGARSRAARESRDLLDKASGRGLAVVLDESGETMTSREFARFLGDALASRSELTFVLGGPEGTTQALAAAAARKISLSRMTLTHEMARVFLAEQIYRALSIMKGAPYHR